MGEVARALGGEPERAASLAWREIFSEGIQATCFPANSKQRWPRGALQSWSARSASRLWKSIFEERCWQRIEEQRMLQALTGNPLPTKRSRKK